MNAATRHLSKARSEANLTDAKIGSARRYRRMNAAQTAEYILDNAPTIEQGDEFPYVLTHRSRLAYLRLRDGVWYINEHGSQLANIRANSAVEAVRQWVA